MEIDGKAILIINLVAGLTSMAIPRYFRAVPKQAFMGYYLILMSAGFAVWENPGYWVQALFAVVGLTWITVAVARANKPAPEAEPEPS